MIFNSSGLIRCVCKVNLQAFSTCIYLHVWTKNVLLTVLFHKISLLYSCFTFGLVV